MINVKGLLLLAGYVLLHQALLHLHHSQDFSITTDNSFNWWTGRCGKAVNHQQSRSPGQSYLSPLGSSPWQVAIFAVRRRAKRQTKIIDFNPGESSAINKPELRKSRAASVAGPMTFLCVGTIISPSIIITAASCLFTENTKKAIRPERLRVIAAKQSLSLKHEIDAQTREVQLVELMVTYEGEITSQAENLAIIATQREFFINKYVQPVCVDVEKRHRDLKRGLHNNTIEGAAFGLSKQLTSSGELREAVFQFQNFTQCRSRVPEDSTIQYYLHYDKFCIDTPKGRLPEDTGMGLVTLVEDRYYLQGVLSANVLQEFSVVTNVSEHTAWLKKVVTKAMDNIQCKNMFICNNKACLEPSRKCDGFDDCGDGSDESAIVCGNKLSGDIEKTSCELPYLLSGGLFSFEDRSCVENCTLGSGDKVAAGQSVQLTCGQGTAVPAYNPLGSYACLNNGRWSPEQPQCILECAPLEKQNVNISCEYNYHDVSCNKYMRPGTIAIYRCDPFYVLLDPVSPRETKCLEGGRWRSEPPDCVPECGVPNPFASNVKPTIAFGVDTKNVLEYPWQVGIHNKNSSHSEPKWSQHCGGSIISPHLVLTAAHCLHHPNDGPKFKTEDILVTAGKYKRDFYDTEEAQQDSTVKELITLPAYNGYNTHYAHDIGIVELKRPFVMSSYVLPVCLKYGQILDLSNTVGTLVGWGFTEKKSVNGQVGVSSDILLKSELPLVTLEDCKRIKKPSKGQFRDNFYEFLTYDKICGSFQNGSGPQPGDSGGGIIVNKGPRWYVIGIASVIDQYNIMAGITNVHSHQNFIRDTIRTHKGRNPLTI